jgi:hypothetical protein
MPAIGYGLDYGKWAPMISPSKQGDI